MALNKALTIRMRVIELLAKASGIIDSGQKKVVNQAIFAIDKDTQRRMLEHQLHALDAPKVREVRPVENLVKGSEGEILVTAIPVEDSRE